MDRNVGRDSLGREICARYAWVEAERLAIIEMSEASGLWRGEKGGSRAGARHTFGTGQLIRHA